MLARDNKLGIKPRSTLYAVYRHLTTEKQKSPCGAAAAVRRPHWCRLISAESWAAATQRLHPQLHLNWRMKCRLHLTTSSSVPCFFSFSHFFPTRRFSARFRAVTWCGSYITAIRFRFDSGSTRLIKMSIRPQCRNTSRSPASRNHAGWPI